MESAGVTLKIMSRSSKSNQIFSPSHASWVKIYLQVQKIMHGNEAMQRLALMGSSTKPIP